MSQYLQGLLSAYFLPGKREEGSPAFINKDSTDSFPYTFLFPTLPAHPGSPHHSQLAVNYTIDLLRCHSALIDNLRQITIKDSLGALIIKSSWMGENCMSELKLLWQHMRYLLIIPQVILSTAGRGGRFGRHIASLPTSFCLIKNY